MKHIQTIISSLLFIAISCGSPEDPKLTPNDTPKAFKEGSVVESMSYGRSGDLVDEIYAEMVGKSPELRDIENNISKLLRSKKDSIKTFELYDVRNSRFYTSADSHVSQISDSLLRLQIKSILEESKSKYRKSTERQNSLLKTIELKEAALKDIHIVLKLYTALPIIEGYQNKNLPSSTQIENLIKEYDTVTNQIKDLTKKKNGH